jgi:hypothetical protein
MHGKGIKNGRQRKVEASREQRRDKIAKLEGSKKSSVTKTSILGFSGLEIASIAAKHDLED